MTTRRRFLKHAAAVGGATLFPKLLPLSWGARATQDPAAQDAATQGPAAQGPGTMLHAMPPPPESFKVRPFADPLTIPPVLRPRPGQTLQIAMSAFKQKLHSQLPPTPLWGYGGTYPGPTIEVQSGVPQTVQWSSKLPTRHFLPIDPTIHGAAVSTPEVRTVVHLHGAKVPPESDGYPDSWFTSDGRTGPTFKPGPYVYPNDQRAGMLWYHDHAIGITRLNIYAGLAGMYIIRDAQEQDLNLPSGDYEIPLLIQDRLFNADGSLLYPSFEATHPYWIPEFMGDTVLVNGVAFPYLDVEPRRYRLRMVNGSNARFYHMTFADADASGNPTGKPGPNVFQIGSDGGFLPWPVLVKDLLAAPGERFDIIVDFTSMAGRNVVITNDDVVPSDDMPAPAADGSTDNMTPPKIMLFRVSKPLQAPDKSSLPNRLSELPPTLNPTTIAASRFLSITEIVRDSDGYPVIGLLDKKMWSDPVSEKPKAGTTEFWYLINTTGDTHPIHLHLVQFQVDYRMQFDLDLYNRSAEIVARDEPESPDISERNAMKDTVKTYPGTMTRLVVKFDLPKGTRVEPGKAYRYVWHCHTLEHEDNEMMRPYDVIG